MSVIKDIISILSGLSLVDYILYFSVLVLIILVTALYFVIKNEEDKDVSDQGSELMPNEEKDLDLKQIVNSIEQAPKVPIEMTSYEQEQEQKAIISYDELVKEARNQQINYEDETLVDDCIPIKKINLSNLIEETKQNPNVDTKPVPLFHYEQEEAFLKTLKELNELLN